MNIGMLWFDNDKNSDLNAKVFRAVKYYRTKYGRTPTLCYIHPSMMSNTPLETKSADNKVSAGDVELRTTTLVMPNHFWIGLNGPKSSKLS
jgi:hypothetical protein